MTYHLINKISRELNQTHTSIALDLLTRMSLEDLKKIIGIGLTTNEYHFFIKNAEMINFRKDEVDFVFYNFFGKFVPVHDIGEGTKY